MAPLRNAEQRGNLAGHEWTPRQTSHGLPPWARLDRCGIDMGAKCAIPSHSGNAPGGLRLYMASNERLYDNCTMTSGIGDFWVFSVF
jgi:hypothetical protein